jgi:hypothetical protein
MDILCKHPCEASKCNPESSGRVTRSSALLQPQENLCSRPHRVSVHLTVYARKSLLQSVRNRQKYAVTVTHPPPPPRREFIKSFKLWFSVPSIFKFVTSAQEYNVTKIHESKLSSKTTCRRISVRIVTKLRVLNDRGSVPDRVRDFSLRTALRPSILISGGWLE